MNLVQRIDDSRAAPQACSSCRFARVIGPDLECRRRAPVAEQVSPTIDIRRWVPRFPIMRWDDGCGEFEIARRQ